MATAQKLKASEKQALVRKLTALLKKEYKSGTAPRDQRSVLDTLLFAICLEDASRDDAEAAIARMDRQFHDLNEVRVSSISELTAAFQGVDKPEWKALRMRSVLQYVFEKHFAFDFEALRRKTHEQASKQLEKVRDLSPFVRNHVLHEVLGAHVIPLDDAQRRAAVWLGLVAPGTTVEHASEDLKPAIRKADAPLFCHLLRRLAVDSRFAGEFQQAAKQPPEGGFDPETACERLAALLASPGKSRKSNDKKPASGKPARKTASAKKKTTKRPAARGKK